MNAIALGLCTLAGLVLLGLILYENRPLRRDLYRQHQQARAGRRPSHIKPAELGQVNGEGWPDGWKGIPRSEDPGDGTQ